MSGLARKYGGRFSGMLAHVVQRITGLLLLAYLFLHVRTIYALHDGPAAFDRAVATFNSPLFKLLEIALFGTVILHAMNGLRLTLLDLGRAHGRQRQLFWIWSIGLGGLIFLAGAIPLFLDSVWRR